MPDYAAAYAAFDPVSANASLILDGQGVNAAMLCCDRWCGEDRVALRWIQDDGVRGDLTFEALRDEAMRAANLFAGLGVGPGDKVAGLLPRTSDLLVTIMATWRLGAVYQPLFTAFGPKAIEHRLAGSNAKVVVTDAANRAKLSDAGSGAAIVVTSRTAVAAESDIVMVDAMAAQPAYHEAVLRDVDDPFLMMFTSGTTGAAKPLLVPLKAIAAFVAYMRDAVDLRSEDRFWNVADPGWAYGLYYGVTGPLAMGNTVLFYQGGFTPAAAVGVIAGLGITNLAGSPTAFRQIVNAGPEAVAPIAGQLRVVSSAGEPLNADIVTWFAEHLRVPIFDHYGQTELGMVVCNHHGLTHPVVAGTAGYATPGHRVVVLDDDDAELPPGRPGILSIDIPRSPAFWFGGYEVDSGVATGRFYRSGDTVELNQDGSISFVGRSDDVITSSGYRIGPFDVESALVEHAAVAEAAVIGKPDPDRTEIVKAFIVLRDGVSGSDSLIAELQRHVKSRLSAHAYPREIAFVSDLPKTPSGKIQRFLLRAAERQANPTGVA